MNRSCQPWHFPICGLRPDFGGRVLQPTEARKLAGIMACNMDAASGHAAVWPTSWAALCIFLIMVGLLPGKNHSTNWECIALCSKTQSMIQAVCWCNLEAAFTTCTTLPTFPGLSGPVTHSGQCGESGRKRV